MIFTTKGNHMQTLLLTLALLAFPAAADIFPVETTLIHSDTKTRPCWASYRIHSNGYSISPWAQYLSCGQGYLQDDPAEITAFVTMQQRSTTKIEARFAQPITRLTVAFCQGCTGPISHFGTVQVSVDSGATWRSLGAASAPLYAPNPRAVMPTYGARTQTRAIRERSITFTQATTLVWIKGVKDVDGYYPDIFHVRGQ